MILFKTELKQSNIHGIGIFTKEFIPKGSKVWEFKDGFDLIIPKEKFNELSDGAKEQVLNYAYISKKTGSYVLCTDDSRFFNHSSKANTTCVVPDILNSDEDLECFAIKDINIGEELTNNYEEFDADLSDLSLT
ncbi:MAG: SET domain-containing protein [bacterium]